MEKIKGFGKNSHKNQQFIYFWLQLMDTYITIILQHRVSDQTNDSECDWSNLQIFLFLIGCNTQGVKDNCYICTYQL